MQQLQTPILLAPIDFNLTAQPHTLINRVIMEWTNDEALELIEQYRIHTELWNRADPKYKDKLCRFRAWSEIAERFGCSKAEVERKMNVLLTQYRREKHKMLIKLYQGIQPNPSKWYAFKRFDFMEAGGGSSSSSRSGTNGHTSTSTAASLNGLNSYETITAAAQQTTSAAVAVAATTANAAPSTSQHRRMKKEMKYFGAMGISLPMLIASNTALDTWNTVGQYSPPIDNDRNPLRVPLPMPFPNSQSEMNVASSATRSLFGGSSNSDITASPQKPMESSDIEDKDEILTKRERSTPSSLHNVSGSSDVGAHVNCVGNTAITERCNSDNTCGISGRTGVEGAIVEPNDGGSSPISNIIESHEKRRRTTRDHEELDIKRELVDYFHPPHPPAPPDSHRSYSSIDENRIGGADPDDFAQDLRVSAAAAAAAKGINFSQFVLPRNLRHSSESIDEKFAPLNMRKLSSVSATASTAGQMLMNSLLSNESLSEETATSTSGRIKSTSQEAASTSAAAAAAAIYAESLNKDDCDFIGSNVTLKLRSMDRTQRIIAEKLISEVLFYGQFNELERNAHIQPK
ncbi:pneumococcal serine-rich repeat protein [Bactrocera dorsalis]|uniref:Pneumococcal serine-rich repeat protein n=1 Tax=Bactrocera dorsalis TaxID=27457 RepID=A0A6J0RMQ3_BACDO|nr:pneumococcal serine-rich repeat protein [Bactrocera dorsalis]XP_011207900.2 pneumococcal serine-rich repeat protein [Bactrocera dorsalis]XP_019846988.2 pneumococcal serine-rich repeat protein [Bactrocera dorsalis]